MINPIALIADVLRRRSGRRKMLVTGRVMAIIPPGDGLPTRVEIRGDGGSTAILHDNLWIRRLRVGDTVSVTGINMTQFGDGRTIRLRSCRILELRRPRPARPKEVEW